MSRIFRVQLTPSVEKRGAVMLDWEDPDGRAGLELIALHVVKELLESSRAFMRERNGARAWMELAEKLYEVLNIGRCAIKNFHGGGCPPLELRLRAGSDAFAWPFELIRMVSDIRVIREVDTASSSAVCGLGSADERMLMLLFIACAPQFSGDDFERGQLYFEKEEEAIFDAITKGAVELDVEDTGSLGGLAERLGEDKFDVVHISCHANIDAAGPCLFMETDVGDPHRVGPEALWENCLKQRQPRIVFLSACRTGESDPHEAASSFCEKLVARGLPMSIGWGISVADPNATRAAQIFYGELALGITALEAVTHTREKLMYEGDLFWPFLRVFVSPEVEDFAIVLPPGGRKRLPKRRITKLKQLSDAGVNALAEGFIGRRREIQHGLRSLRDTTSSGVFIHGAVGLGKSCLAARLAERFSDRELIIVRGPLNEISFASALVKGFNRSKNLPGIKMLKEADVAFRDKIPVFCSTVFRETPYIILLDDFDVNVVVESGEVKGLAAGAESVLAPLLENLPECMGVTKLIITGRRAPGLDGLEYIPMRSMRGAEEKKKVERLNNINSAPPLLRKKFIEAGCGNPALLERLDGMFGRNNSAPPDEILLLARRKAEKFVGEQIDFTPVGKSVDKFEAFLSELAVFDFPVSAGVINAILKGPSFGFLEKGAALGLIEKDIFSRRGEALFMVSPPLRERLFRRQDMKKRRLLHDRTTKYFVNHLVAETTQVFRPVAPQTAYCYNFVL